MALRQMTKLSLHLSKKKTVQFLLVRDFGLDKMYGMKNLILSVGIICFISCNQADKSNTENDSAEKEIKSTIDNYYNDIRKEGLAAELKYLDSSKEFFWIAPGYLNYIGYDSVVAAVRRNAVDLKSVDNRYDSLLIIPLTNNYAQFAMRTISTAVHATGETTKTAFIESGVMVKRKDGWKFLSGQTTILE